MDQAAIRNALLKRGTHYREIPGPLIDQLETVASLHGLDAKGIANAFDKFMTTSRAQNTAGVTAEDLEAFTEHYSKAQRAAASRTSNLFDRGLSWENAGAALGGILGGSSDLGSGQPSNRISPYLSKAAAARTPGAAKPRTPASTGKFKERAQSGEVVALLNSHVTPPAERMEMEGSSGGCEVEVLGAVLPRGAKYMMNRLEEKVEHLERRITALEDAVEVQGLEPHCVSRAAQEQAVFVGRICCDTEEGRLNQQSTLLEGSMRHSQGSRVRLDLSKCQAYRLFPGQVVAVRGANPSGQCIVASEVIGGLPLPMQRSSLQQLAQYAEATDRRGLSVVVAAGPFTTSEDCEYEPLAALLEYCTAHKPDVLLLAGPFVDAEHPSVKGGMLDETFDELFESRVLAQLEAFCSGSGAGVKVLVMPSVKDVHHHPVHPQPPLDLEEASALGSLPSPATLRCNEVVIGCTSSDWLMACSSQEISRTAGQTDRLPALASHILSQHSYMPMFPPPPALPLDSGNATALELPCTPDILVLPSDLQPFAKVVPVQRANLAAAAAAGAAGAGAGGPSAMDTDAGQAVPAAGPSCVQEGNVVCINPGRLAKGTTGGTFAHVYIPPLKEALDVAGGAAAATNGAVPHAVDARCRVEIRRI